MKHQKMENLSQSKELISLSGSALPPATCILMRISDPDTDTETEFIEQFEVSCTPETEI